MTTVVARTVASIPARTAIDTWSCIVDLIAPERTAVARRELAAVAGIACSLIADKALEDDPLVVHGAGPRLRMYCVYDDDALEGDAVREDPLSFDATAGDWRMSLPCPEDDLPWASRALAKVSARVTARAAGTEVGGGPAKRTPLPGRSTASGNPMPVDLDAFLRE